MSETVGFLGLGIMGRPMAENLAKKFRVVGFDSQESKFNGILGVERADSAASVAGQCSVVCLSLPSAAIVESVILAPGGLIDTLAEGSLILDLSTGLPSVSRKISGAVAVRNIGYADVPVSGGEAGAKAAALAIMVGASQGDYLRALPYLSALGSSVIRAGEVGAGNVAKLVNNMIVGVTFGVISEGFSLAVKNGLDPLVLYQAIQGGWAGSKVLDVSAPAIAARQYLPGGTINMMQKDLSYARTLAAESQASIPMTAAAHEIFVAAQAMGRGAESQPAIFELWARQEAP